MEPKVWVVGLGRTGTKSLCRAAVILGYTAVKHNPPFFEDFRTADFAAEASCQFHFEYLDARFPGSKFVLTTRDLEPWLHSCKRAMEELYPSTRIPEDSPYYDPMIRNRMARYGCLTYDERTLTETYFRHHDRILTYFKARREDLLVMNVGKGNEWETLCPFLGIAIPSVPFPSVGDLEPDDVKVRAASTIKT